MTPITGTLRAIDYEEISLEVFLQAITKINARIGLQYSDDPIGFSNPITKELTAYLSTLGWSYSPTTYDLWNLSGLVDADYMMYLRFVALGKTTNASTKAESLTMRTLIHSKPVVARSLLAAWIRANSKGSTTDATFHPCTGALLSKDVAVHRVQVERAANTGCTVQAGYQQTNTPDDPTSWGTVTTLGSALTGNGCEFPGKVQSVTLTKRHVRYGVTVKNTSGTDIEALLARLLVETRDR